MRHLEWTFLRPGALGQFISRIFTNVVTFTLPFVAILAEVSRAPAEPRSYAAAELALEVDKVCSVLVAFLLATANFTSSAFWANQFFRFEFLLIIACRSYAIFFTAEIRIFTLKALVVSQFVHCKFRQVVIE